MECVFTETLESVFAPVAREGGSFHEAGDTDGREEEELVAWSSGVGMSRPGSETPPAVASKHMKSDVGSHCDLVGRWHQKGMSQIISPWHPAVGGRC